MRRGYRRLVCGGDRFVSRRHRRLVRRRRLMRRGYRRLVRVGDRRRLEGGRLMRRRHGRLIRRRRLVSRRHGRLVRRRRLVWGLGDRGRLEVGRCGRFGGRGQILRRHGRCARLELGPAGQAPPERDDLLGRRLPAPRSEQELLGEGPQVHRVGLAPRQRVAGQRQRGARRQQGVGLHGGHSGAGRVERPELLPAHGGLQELCRDAAQRVPGPAEVVGPHRNDHRRLIGVRTAGGPADDLSVGDHALGQRVALAQRLRAHGGRLPQRLLRPVLGRRLIRRDDDPRVLVAEGLVEYGGTLAVPGLGGLAVLARHRDVRHAGLVTGAVTPPRPLEHGQHQESEPGAPGEQEDQRDDVDDVAGRVCPVVDAGAGLGPVRRQGRLGRAE